MDDSHATLRPTSLRTLPCVPSPTSRWVKLLASPILLATFAASSHACPPWVSRSHCNHHVGHVSSHAPRPDCRPIGTWTMVQGPNSFPSCGPCGCGQWQSEWPSPYAVQPPWTTASDNQTPNNSASPQALSPPPNDSMTQPKPPPVERPSQQDRSATDQPNWRPPTGQVPPPSLPAPDTPTSDPKSPKSPIEPTQKPEKERVKDLELLFGDPPIEAPLPPGDPSQSRWIPRNDNPQENDLTTRYANARFSSASSLPLGQQAWRTWTDHTGSFRVRATLVEAGAYHVVLLKENGRTTTLPISRLSPEDAVYLRLGK